MISRVMIDPNVRVRGNGTFAGLEDVRGPIAVGQRVEVYEPESALFGDGRVTEIDTERELVFLAVDWPSLRDREAEPGHLAGDDAVDVVNGDTYLIGPVVDTPTSSRVFSGARLAVAGLRNETFGWVGEPIPLLQVAIR